MWEASCSLCWKEIFTLACPDFRNTAVMLRRASWGIEKTQEMESC